jgi:hypothetical protein
VVYKDHTNGQSGCQKRMGIVGALLFVTATETCCSDSMILVKSSKTKTLPSCAHCVRVEYGKLFLHSVRSSIMGGGRRHRLIVLVVGCGGVLADIVMRWHIFHDRDAAVQDVFQMRLTAALDVRNCRWCCLVRRSFRSLEES